MKLEVLFTPAEFALLPQRDLGRTLCVVFDVLRATTSMVTALAHGAKAIRPCEQIKEAIAFRKLDPEILLAGERNGVRITTDLTGGIEFDLGNSPREFIREKVGGKQIAMTTTNGTRALKSCAHAQTVLIGSFPNLQRTAEVVRLNHPGEILIVCSGTFEEAAFEDVLAAGALCELLGEHFAADCMSDASLMSRKLFQGAQGNLPAAISASRNGRKLLSQSELKDDVSFCAQRNIFNLGVELGKDGWVRRLEASSSEEIQATVA